MAEGSSAAQLRSYTKKLARETWDYVNWLTHARSAIHRDAEIGIAAVSHFLASITAVRLHWSDLDHARCDQCGSYAMYAGRCPHCGWIDESHGRFGGREPDPDELAARLAQPCTPSSNISTFITVDDVAKRMRRESS